MTDSPPPIDVHDIELVPKGRAVCTVQLANANLGLDARGRLIATETMGASLLPITLRDQIRNGRLTAEEQESL